MAATALSLSVQYATKHSDAVYSSQFAARCEPVDIEEAFAECVLVRTPLHVTHTSVSLDNILPQIHLGFEEE